MTTAFPGHWDACCARLVLSPCFIPLPNHSCCQSRYRDPIVSCSTSNWAVCPGWSCAGASPSWDQPPPSSLSPRMTSRKSGRKPARPAARLTFANLSPASCWSKPSAMRSLPSNQPLNGMSTRILNKPERRDRRARPDSGLRNFQLLADGTPRALFNFPVAGDTGELMSYGIGPDRVVTTFSVENASIAAEMPFQLRQLHVPANSIVSRNASGESSFSDSSRWHSSTSLSASSRFALASSSVLPWEIVAGISSMKQEYPPSFAGSKTAVNFTPSQCHPAPPDATGSCLNEGDPDLRGSSPNNNSSEPKLTP